MVYGLRVGFILWIRDTGRSWVDCALRGRIGEEEAMLTRELPGYQEYTQNVPYRLVPHLRWR